ncbi:MAG: hypothetical protein IPO81_17060 [Kouleothrix sp.]|nr:hypothetical protein [Kouleothrix sp.]
MGDIRQGPPEFLILHLLERYAIPNFVETGTFQGSTAAWASRHFKRVFTIEFAEPIYRQALATHGGLGNISFLYGHTREKLAEVVAQLDAPSLFWLDAHWSGGQTYGAGDECPVLDEIAIIDQTRADSFILIDDARLFLAPPPRPHRAEQWPDITAVIGRLSQRHDRYVAVVDDVVVAAPAHARADLAGYLQDLATARWQAAQPSGGKPGLRGQAQRVYYGVKSRLRQRG